MEQVGCGGAGGESGYHREQPEMSGGLRGRRHIIRLQTVQATVSSLDVSTQQEHLMLNYGEDGHALYILSGRGASLQVTHQSQLLLACLRTHEK